MKQENDDNINLLVDYLLKQIDYNRMIRFDDYPSKHQFVFTSYNTMNNNIKRLGYCVQVRKNRGLFGSHIVFLRHADGILTTHENQAYYTMTKIQEELCRTFFRILPEDENDDTYSDYETKTYEKGFLIE